MAQMTYGDLTTYGALDTYALETGSGSGSNPSGGGETSSCPWTSAQITTILSALDALLTAAAAIKAKTDLLPSSPAATGDAMTLTSAYNAAKTAAQPGDAMTLTAAYNAAKNAAAPGAAMTLTSAYDKAKTAVQVSDLPTDYAKPADVQLTTTTQTVSVTNQQVDLTGIARTSDLTGLAKTTDLPSDYAKPGDAMTLTAAYNAAKGAVQDSALTQVVTLLNLIHDLLGDWSISGTTLTAGATTYTLTQDNGTITEVHPYEP